MTHVSDERLRSLATCGLLLLRVVMRLLFGRGAGRLLSYYYD